ncbi:hypothetical protein [Fluviispira multicolorata]|uniref:Uncharacterized protein n=1 Tax=Fluviispira multicolorata TaxID=2654512 RepID=A0A833N4N3_9BACT|nr:hypothetical protein [Fluviispira multicolorata]KAB8030996.1 hypothetical protein GCL57_08490 [Fluviispira multicolorata]
MLKFIKGQNTNLSSDHGSGSEQEDEPDRPPVLVTTVIVVFSFLFLLIVAIVASTVLWKATEAREKEVQTGMGDHQRIEYVKNQEEILSSYKKLDDGYYQIPIAQAVKQFVKEQNSN